LILQHIEIKKKLCKNHSPYYVTYKLLFLGCLGKKNYTTPTWKSGKN